MNFDLEKYGVVLKITVFIQCFVSDEDVMALLIRSIAFFNNNCLGYVLCLRKLFENYSEFVMDEQITNGILRWNRRFGLSE